MKLLLNLLIVIAVVFAIVWLLNDPPIIAGSTHPAYVLGWVLLVAAGLATVFMYAVIASLPRDITLEPMDADGANARMMRRMDEAEAEGFELAGPVLKVGMPFPTALVPMVHRDGQAYATFFSIQAKNEITTSFDIVTLFEGDGGLTTNTEPAGACTPPAVGSFRQVFPGANIATLLEQHRAGIAHLQREGAVVAPHTADQFDAAIRHAINRSRDTFLRNPLGYTAIAFWRTVTKTTPHIGPIAKQRSTPALLRRWQKHRPW